MFGFLVIDKPAGVSSRAALNEIARLYRPAKVGHAGTLDPLATGVLVACIGPATRLVGYVQQLPKKYTAQFRLGFESETEDIESKLIPVENAVTVSRVCLQSVLSQFVGTIEQQPPQYSALWVNGKRAYRLARRGAEFELKSRTIEIFQLNLKRFDYPDFELEIECGSGTYVRSLGRDIGRAVNSGAVMTSLVRTAIGNFQLEDDVWRQGDRSIVGRIELEQQATVPQPSVTELKKLLLHPINGLTLLKSVSLTDEQLAGLIHAVPIRFDQPVGDHELAAVDRHDRLIAVLQPQPDGTFSPKINFANYWKSQSTTN